MPRTILIELHFLPSINYIRRLARADEVILERHEHYTKGSYRNRCHIAGVNGPLRLSIPLKKGKNEQQPITQTAISYDMPWPSQHWTSIQSAYGNAPFWEHYAPIIEPVFKSKKKGLFDYNLSLLETVLELMQLPVTVSFSDRYHSHAPSDVKDWRNVIRPKKQHKEMALKAEEPLVYPQVFEDKNGFLPNLSVLDLLFCCGPEGAMILDF